MPIKLLFIALAASCLTPFVAGWLALLMGILFALLLGNPFLEQIKSITPKLLALSIVGLGASIHLNDLLALGVKGMALTAVSIALVIALGLVLGRLLKLDQKISGLITFGTAICGGSAIAALSPVIKAKNEHISIALAIVFTLNALALFMFPLIGEWLELTQKQFGIWAALAIHDTSSVVGAAMQYGDEALEVATTIKLVRALWIVPIIFLLALYLGAKENTGEKNALSKIKLPWFIVGFVAMACLVTFVPALESAGEMVSAGAKKMLVLVLFLIGAGLSKEALKQVGFKPMFLGMALWFIVSIISLLFATFYL